MLLKDLGFQGRGNFTCRVRLPLELKPEQLWEWARTDASVPKTYLRVRLRVQGSHGCVRSKDLPEGVAFRLWD